MLNEVKTERLHYFVNDLGKIHGIYKDYTVIGNINKYASYHNGKLHGELILYLNGNINNHFICVHGDPIHNLLLNPLSNEELMLLCLEHGFKRLPDYAQATSRNVTI